MRHGDAEFTMGADFERRLTRRGEEEVRRCAMQLVAREITLDAIFCSPLVRAMQTTQLVRETVGPGAMVEPSVSQRLVPEADPGETLVFLDGLTGVEQVLAVTHQPLVSRLIQLLTGERIGMGTANLAMIDCPVVGKGCGVLECVI